MPSRLSRFTDRLVTLAKRAVCGDLDTADKKGDGGYADWVIIVIHGLREYLYLPYRQLLDVLHEMHGIVEKIGLKTDELPSFTTVCARKQQLNPSRIAMGNRGMIPIVRLASCVDGIRNTNWTSTIPSSEWNTSYECTSSASSNQRTMASHPVLPHRLRAGSSGS